MFKAIETVYKGYRFRSRLEARWAVFFDELGLDWKYEAEGYDFDGVRYLPDFEIHIPRITLLPDGSVVYDSEEKQKLFFEIKGKYEITRSIIDRMSTVTKYIPLTFCYGDPYEMNIIYFDGDVFSGKLSALCTHNSNIHLVHLSEQQIVLSNNMLFECKSVYDLARKYPDFITGEITSAASEARQARFEYGENITNHSFSYSESTKHEHTDSEDKTSKHVTRGEKNLWSSPEKLSVLHSIGLQDQTIRLNRLGVLIGDLFSVPFIQDAKLIGMALMLFTGKGFLFTSETHPATYIPQNKYNNKGKKQVIITSNPLLSILINQEMDCVTGISLGNIRNFQDDKLKEYIDLLIRNSVEVLFAVPSTIHSRRDELIANIQARLYVSLPKIQIENNLDIDSIKGLYNE